MHITQFSSKWGLALYCIYPFKSFLSFRQSVADGDLSRGHITSTTTAVDIPDVTVTDNADPSPAVSYSPLGPGDEYPDGTTTVVVVTVTDASGNTASCEFTVTVDGERLSYYAMVKPSRKGRARKTILAKWSGMRLPRAVTGSIWLLRVYGDPLFRENRIAWLLRDGFTPLRVGVLTEIQNRSTPTTMV